VTAVCRWHGYGNHACIAVATVTAKRFAMPLVVFGIGWHRQCRENGSNGLLWPLKGYIMKCEKVLELAEEYGEFDDFGRFQFRDEDELLDFCFELLLKSDQFLEDGDNEM
jgi:hypothetical protein